MAGPSADRITEWEGGSLSELVAMLQAAALPVRIEVMAPGTTDSISGEVHLLAGGLADAFAGSLRRDDAMAALQRLEGARYVIECRLPDPETGSLSEPGPHHGSLKDRPLASLMRYCEDYVLTCRLEVWRGQDRAAISYRRGEIIGTVVGGSEGSDRLPEVMGWSEGSYEILLPAPVLPQMPARSREGARPERKRHTTLPMIPGQEPKLDGPAAAKSDAGPKSAVTPPPRPATAPPVAPASAGSARVTPPPAPQRPAPQPAVAARPPAPQPASPAQPGLAVHKPVVRPPLPTTVTPKPIVAVLASALQPEMTTRGTPPVPAVPLVPAQAPQPASRPTMQGPGVPLVPPKPAAPAPPKAAAPAAQPAVQAPPKAAAPAAQPAVQAPPKAAAPAAQPAPQAQQKPVQPAAQAPRKPTPLSVQPAVHAPPKAAAPAAQPAPQAPRKLTPLVVQPAPQSLPKPAAPAVAASPSAPPVAQSANQAEKPQAAPARAPKPSPAGSNDLMPASGTIQAKPKHGSYLPPTTPPIQIAEEPPMAPTEQPPTPVMAPQRPPRARRERAAAGKGLGDHPVRAYVLVGLAIGAGIVLAYWAYWYLPFGHH